MDYQIRFLVRLLDNESASFNDKISSPSIPLEDPFVYLVSLIHHLKTECSQYIHCSINESNHWSFQNGLLEHKHLLTYHKEGQNHSIDIHWHIKILEDHHFNISIHAKDQKNINIQLPMGQYKIDEQRNPFYLYFKIFHMEMNTLIFILLQSVE